MCIYSTVCKQLFRVLAADNLSVQYTKTSTEMIISTHQFYLSKFIQVPSGMYQSTYHSSTLIPTSFCPLEIENTKSEVLYVQLRGRTFRG